MVTERMLFPQLPPVTFEDLAQRLLSQLAGLIHSGAITERRLASIVGFSQPHLHNVINGTRKLTPAVADQVMYFLEWSLLDLLNSEEARALLEFRHALACAGREIPLCRSGVGPGLLFPGEELGEITVPNSWLSRTDIPVAVTAGEDPEMEAVIEAGDILLIDRLSSVSETIQEDALYVVRRDGESLARWVRFSSRGLYLVSTANWCDPSRWTLVAIQSSRRTQIIEGEIIALARPLDRTFRRPAPPFASN